jgi:FMN reductase
MSDATSDELRIAVVVGNPRPGSRTRRAAEAVAIAVGRLGRRTDRSVSVDTIELAELASELFAPASRRVEAAMATVAAAHVLVVASPTYKAAYTGLLKAFLDRFSSTALAGVVGVPVMMGGAPIHALAVEVHLRPVLVELSLTCPTRGLFIVEAELDQLDATVDAWLAAHEGPLSVLLG